MISKQAAVQLYTVLKDYVPRERISNLLLDLRNRVPGNQSYRDTIDAMVHLHEAESPRQESPTERSTS